jgi:hypothetical protein
MISSLSYSAPKMPPRRGRGHSHRLADSRCSMHNGVTRQSLARVTVVALLAVSTTVPGIAAQRTVQYIRGQSVAPVYDGYEVNPDGTFSLWFGYFNRNQQEHLEIPIGSDNQFEPGPADRGQPTHFVPTWQKSAFRVVVGKDFGNQKLTWRLRSHEKVETVVATLDPRSIIDRRKTTLEGVTGENLAPTVAVEPASQTVTLPGTARVTVTGTDDGRPMNARTKKPAGLSLKWRKYRGPATGLVTFEPATAQLEEGKAVATASFSEPGTYVIQAYVEDGSSTAGTYCCWINTEVTVHVVAAPKR